MSAFTPKADMERTSPDVGYVPVATKVQRNEKRADSATSPQRVPRRDTAIERPGLQATDVVRWSGWFATGAGQVENAPAT